MDGIYFIGVGQAIFIAALLLAKDKKSTGDWILIAWMLASAAMLVFFYLNFIEATSRFTPLLIVLGCLPFLTASLVYLYVKALTSPTLKHWQIWPHSILFFAVVFMFFYYYWFTEDSAGIRIGDGYINRGMGLPFLLRYYPLILAGASFLYPAISLLLLFRHQQVVLNEFSYQESITLKWLRNWIVLELVAFFISYFVIQAGSVQMFDIVMSFRVLATLISINIFVVGFYGLRQPIIFKQEKTLVDQVSDKEKYKSSNLSDEESREILNRLETKMKEDLLFTRQSLSITELANEIDISKHRLSQVINAQQGSNFYDYVNRYRVDAFKARLDDPQYEHLTMLGIALECGFSSKSSFNQVFKRVEGVTPSQFKAQRGPD
ncbi:MAG: helix-turn-helix domain-containing protein [Cytophagales bacterium]|nr:helix-turn-helix domain-containing protein [Cytophagales bacterium]